MLRRIIEPFREFGFVAGVLYATDRVLRAISPRLCLFAYELMVQPISDKPLLPAKLASALEFREIRYGDPDVDLMPARSEIKQSRFKQGAICLGAYKKGALIGYIWFCFGSYDEDEVRCTYQLANTEQSVFDFDLYVFPEHRMGLGFMGVWHGANQYLRSRGIRYTFSRLTRFNVVSRRSHKHLGWKLVGRAIFVKAWHVEMMLATIAPYLSLSLRPPRTVRLRLEPTVLEPKS